MGASGGLWCGARLPTTPAPPPCPSGAVAHGPSAPPQGARCYPREGERSMHSERFAHSTSAPARGEDRVPSAQATRAAAAATNAQLQALLALTDTALSNLALDDLLPELLGRLTAVMGVDNAALLLLDEDGQTLTVRAARELLEGEAGRVQPPEGQEVACPIAARHEPLVVDDTTTFDRYPEFTLLRERRR